MNASVLVVITNWKRPANVEKIRQSMVNQTVRPTRIVIVDNHTGCDDEKDEFRLFSGNDQVSKPLHPHLIGVDDVFRVHTNLGPPCRFLPVLAFSDCEYTLLVDDDLLPGEMCIEHFVKTARMLNNRFSTLGEIGRIFRRLKDGKWLYRQRNVRRDESPSPIDMECRAHFFLSKYAHHAIALRWSILEKFGEDARQELFIHDDLEACLGIQRATGLRSYLTPLGPPETSIRFRELPDNNAVSRRPEHRTERSRFIERAECVGWNSPLRHDGSDGVADAVPPYVDPPVVVLSDLPAVERMRYATAAKPLVPPDGRAAAGEGGR